MTTGPTDAKVTTAAGGPDGMPLALKLNEGLGFTRVLQQLVQCFAGATLGFARTLLVGVIGVAKVAVLFFGHTEGLRVIRFATLVGALAVAVPVSAQGDTSGCRKEWCEIVDCNGDAAMAANGPRVNDLKPCIQVQVVQFRDGLVDDSTKVIRGGRAPRHDLNSSRHEVTSRDGENRYGQWYWYLQAPITLWWLLWAAGCFRGRGDGHGGNL